MENTMPRKMKDDWEEYFFGFDSGEKELFESVMEMECNATKSVSFIPQIYSKLK